MKKAKVAHIITTLNTGGAEMMLLKTLRNFGNDKYEHFVVSLMPQGNVGRIIEREGFKVYCLNMKKSNFIAQIWKLTGILKKEKPQIAHNYLFHADIFGRLAAKAAGIPVVISSFRNENIGGRWREILLRMTDFCVDAVTAVSKKVADTHVSRRTTKKDKMRVIYNGIEFKDYHIGDIFLMKNNMGIEEGAFVALTVASLEAKKGHQYLLRALEILKDKGCKIKLLLVGDGRQKEKLEREIIKKKLQNEVILTGERQDIAEFLRVADVFVLPSIWEGLPNSLLGAMAAGLPVVATAVGGVPEAVKDNETGLLVRAKDASALAAAIERIMNDKALREHLTQCAKTYVKENFDIRQTVIQTEKLYDELLK